MASIENLLLAADIERRILTDDSRGIVPPGVLLDTFIVSCRDNAEQVLSLSKSVLLSVNMKYREEWPSIHYWQSILPEEFIRRCTPEDNKEISIVEENFSQTLPEDGGIVISNDDRWSLTGWLYWMDLNSPDARVWFWWDAVVLSPNIIRSTFFVMDWDYFWGAYRWLFMGCGAVDVEYEFDYNSRHDHVE